MDGDDVAGLDLFEGGDDVEAFAGGDGVVPDGGGGAFVAGEFVEVLER